MMTTGSEISSACPTPELTPQVYVRWRASELGRLTESIERQLMLELVGDVSGKSVLEVGCGDGDLAIALAKQGAHVAAIDASEEMIEAARERAFAHEADIQFAVATAQDLPFDKKQFDIVVAVTILCFVKDASPVFHEIARVLRPRGYFVIGELGKWSEWAMERRLRAWFGSTLWKRGVFRTPNELKKLAATAGLIPAAVRGAIYYPKWTWAARLLASHDRCLSRISNVGAAFLAVKSVKPTDIK